MSFYPSATIVGVDTPSKYWYTALTSYGRTVPGVRLYGTGAKFSAGQRVTVFQCDEEFGFAENYLGYKNQLVIPDKHKPTIAKTAPASLALAYLANLVDNERFYYRPGTVLEIISTSQMRVSSPRLSSSSLVLTCLITTTGFYVGARVLIRCTPAPVVIGWWNCLPKGNPDAPEWFNDGWWEKEGLPLSGGYPGQSGGLYAIMVAIGRIPFSAHTDITMYEWDEAKGSIEVLRKKIFYNREPYANMAFVSAQPTSNEHTHYYALIRTGINYGALLATYYVKWDKRTFAQTEFFDSVSYYADYASQPPVRVYGYSDTVDPLYMWNTTGGVWVSNSEAGGYDSKLILGYGYSRDQFFPVQDYKYNYLWETE